MKKRILSYMTYMDDLLYEDSSKQQLDYNSLIADHLQQLAFFMHEREVHLYVMILFALLAMADFFVMVIAFESGLVILFLALLVLLIPYIMHYYLLENSCQYMYQQYDEMKRRLAAADGRSVFFEGEHSYRYLSEDKRPEEE